MFSATIDRLVAARKSDLDANTEHVFAAAVDKMTETGDIKELILMVVNETVRADIAEHRADIAEQRLDTIQRALNNWGYTHLLAVDSVAEGHTRNTMLC